MGNCCQHCSKLIHEYINEYQSICDNNQNHCTNDQNVSYQNQITHGTTNLDSNVSYVTDRENQNTIDLPEQFGKLYEISNLVGIGTTAKVYKVYSKINKTPLACKVIEKYTITTGMNMIEIEFIIDQLRKEVDILKRIHHENIVKFYDFMETKDKLLIITEHLDGGELFEYILNNGPLNESNTCQVMYGVFSAIVYLHDRGVIHRDIKPENLIFFRNQLGDISLKLIDFGFSTILKRNLTGSFMGTGGYIAPEIRQNKNYSMSVDSWSLGILLYVTLSAKLPFTISMESLPSQNKQCKEVFDLQFPIKQWINITDSCKNLITMLLETDPMKRITVKEALRHPWFDNEINRCKKLTKHHQKPYNYDNYTNELPALKSNLRQSQSYFQLERKFNYIDDNNKISTINIKKTDKIIFPDISSKSTETHSTLTTTITDIIDTTSNNLHNSDIIINNNNNSNNNSSNINNSNININKNDNLKQSPTYIHTLQWEASFHKSAGDLFYTTYVKQLYSPKKNKFNY